MQQKNKAGRRHVRHPAVCDDETGGLFNGCLDCSFAPRVGDVCHRTSHVDCGECADNHTEEHCECEAADSIATEDEDAEEHKQGRSRSHHRTAQSCVD